MSINLADVLQKLFGGTEKKARFLKKGNIVILAKKLGNRKGVKHRCFIVSDVYLRKDAGFSESDVADEKWISKQKNLRLLARSVRALGVTFSSKDSEGAIPLDISKFPQELKDCLNFTNETSSYLRIAEPIELRAGEVEKELCQCNDYLWKELCELVDFDAYTENEVIELLRKECDCISDKMNIMNEDI